ncbi:Inosine-uridine nucleoside N-ribohydrolase [Catalinimonas alkaloidigena]|uniref:Inosine-uridine nucleoside N-ribohydrolase n=1 Tax=Catalinimonas alkaloidigena TaxID=1075417 RepID=A0A1G9HVD5_9BACT|nr:nucleoside hydrolase [Catalinimonas alkaloidigena]SDL16664.1 Inosine-uridine nucleoside N-ribohydrolase [Catalinimonas alkaloidigena]
MHRRSFLKHAGVAASLPLLTAFPFDAPAQRPPGRRTVLIDADTANEVDDLYAIVRALLEPDFDVRGLASAQWNHRLSPPNTVQESQRINDDLLRLMQRTDIPAPLGAEMIMGKPWGGTEPSDSPAAHLMIRLARALPASQKLTILCLGAVTNLASALALAPDIVPNITVYALGGRYYADRNVWDKDEFNVRNDLNAMNYLFNLDGLELHLMPINVLFGFTFQLQSTLDQLAGHGPVADYLAARWLSNGPDTDERVFWDLALVEAVARPALATERQVQTPPENKPRTIWVYTQVQADAMRTDWWKVAKAGLPAAGR